MSCKCLVKVTFTSLKGPLSRTFKLLTPSTLDSCSYRFNMYLQADTMPSHVVKTVFKYSF